MRLSSEERDDGALVWQLVQSTPTSARCCACVKRSGISCAGKTTGDTARCRLRGLLVPVPAYQPITANTTTAVVAAHEVFVFRAIMFPG